MNERKMMQVTDLLVWTDNPRHGLQDKSDFTTEKDVINLLIDIVGEEKMYNLAKDIFDSHGLMGNVMPTVVEQNNKFWVYDGNRRLSSIKILLDPNLIDSINLRKRIKALTSDTDLSFLNTIDVFLTTEENALTLMDKTHGGELNGVGVIPWDSYQRDISLVKRNKNALYEHAYKIASLLDIKKKKDFSIPYTDLNRLFGSKYLKDTFGIIDLSSIYKQNIIEAIDELLIYKSQKGFKSFSREFNIVDAGTETDSDKPIRKFCEWYLDRKKGKVKYHIKLQSVKLFVDEPYCFGLHNVSITDENGQIVIYTEDELFIEYTTPNGKVSKNFKQSFTGIWKIRVSYKGVEATSEINILPLAEEDVLFNDALLEVEYGTSLDLNNVVLRALNSHKLDMRNTLSIVSIDSARIENNVFMADNPIGNYTVSFRFDNEGKQVAINRNISVVDPKKPMIGVKDASNKPFVFVSNLNLSFSANVAHLVNEINELWGKGYHYVLACSIRSVLELSLDALRENSILTFSNEKKLNVRMEEFKTYLLTSGLTLICNKKPEFFTFLTEKNFVDSLDTEKMISVLHLGAHKSASRLDTSTILEKCQKQISVLIAYIDTLIV